ERLQRELQWSAARRTAERDAVPLPAARPGRPRSLAARLQRNPAALEAGMADTRGLYVHAGHRRDGGAALWYRARACDAYALQSQQRTAAAQAAGRFDDEIVPLASRMKVVDKQTGEVSW